MAKFELKGGIAYIEEGVVELDSCPTLRHLLRCKQYHL